MKQRTMAMMSGFERYSKKTPRAQFLDEMELVVPWGELCVLVEPVYPKAGNGRPPVGVERMLRIYFLQQWFNLSDLAVEEALYDSVVMRSFVGIDLGREPVPDETTMCKFRHLLEEHGLGGQMLEAVNLHLQSRGVRITTGTIVDATIIHAPSSTQNRDEGREILAAAWLEHVHYAIREVAVLADDLVAQGHKILYLNIGDPLKFDFATPPHMIEAVHRAMRDGHNGYAASMGVPEAIDAIAREAERKGIRNVCSIFATLGATEAIDICLTALVNAGDNVLTPSPEYPLYSVVLAKLGAEVNAYALDESKGWEPDLADIERRINPRTRGIVVINPNNPTGALYSQRTLEGIAELARRHHLVVFADEIYDKLLLDGDRHLSIAALAPDVAVITFGGLSKNYLVPGWRVGWGIASGEAAVIQPYLDGAHQLLRARREGAHPQQFAIKAALEGPQDHLQEAIRKLRARRDLTQKWCNETPGVSCVKPRGTFYAFPKLEIEEDDKTFVQKLLTEKHVLLVHGSGFGQAAGTRHARIVFLPDEATLAKAYAAMREFMAARGVHDTQVNR